MGDDKIGSSVAVPIERRQPPAEVLPLKKGSQAFGRDILKCPPLHVSEELRGHPIGIAAGRNLIDMTIRRHQVFPAVTVEIGDLTPSAQTKLLELLQSKEYYPLGAARPLRADVRVIAATNKDLPAEVAARRFREDLYYRLNVIQIRVPSLAERRTDIGLLAAHFCAAACQRHGLPEVALSGNALRALEAAEWPGNVRQLAHAVEAGAIRAAGSGAAQIEQSHLFPAGAATERVPDAPLTFQEATRRFQATLVRETLADTGWNVVETARRLDLTRSHVYNLIRAFGLERNGS